MKNTCKTLVLVLCILATITAQGQNNFFKLRLVAGANFTQVDGDSYGGYNKLGGQLGLGVQTRLKRNEGFNMSLDATLTQKGSKFVARDQSGQVTLEYTMALLMAEVPVLLNYHFGKFFVEGGPAIAFMLDAREKDSNGVLPGRNDFNAFEISGLVGFGIAINPRNNFSARFSKSITPLRSNDVRQRYTAASGEYGRALHIVYKHVF